MDRRALLKAGAAGLVTATAAACGVGRDDSGTWNGHTSLRYGFWGDNIRLKTYSRGFDAYARGHGTVTVVPEFADYTASQERMTTMIAAHDVPDVFWIASPQVLTYEKNDLFHPLDEIPTLHLDDYSKEQLDSFRLNGALNTIPLGVYVSAIRYNEDFARQDGVTFPDGEGPGWTWDKLAELLIDYTRHNGHGRKGLPYRSDIDLVFESWLRQRGEQLWTRDGRIGFTEDGLASWFDWWERLRKAGATLTMSEQEGMAFDWATVGGKVLVNVGDSNHIVDEGKMFPQYRFRQRPAPVAPGAAPHHKFQYYPRLTISREIDRASLKAAGSLIDFNVNNVAMPRATGLSMGAPPNRRVVEAYRPHATRDELEMLNLVRGDQESPAMGTRYEAPAGSNTWRDTMTEIAGNIALGSTSTTAGAREMIDRIHQDLERA
ncbi:ABC transporter substrate-binding protein [Streptomyces sp. TS71-3]|uniref:ABC transporter substrate-binding protein n=1 Tax=Streptomyces sp. TS71-3 TaxID=2733862 RepID=UPI001B252290|nr:ABC transporter substrate-binding protein [Streptomyces sp. TS71-3]GHJ36605.1 sugar ABC transporter substrate-binding protein [Streptomyces sp. TS71-3]